MNTVPASLDIADSLTEPYITFLKKWFKSTGRTETAGINTLCRYTFDERKGLKTVSTSVLGLTSDFGAAFFAAAGAECLLEGMSDSANKAVFISNHVNGKPPLTITQRGWAALCSFYLGVFYEFNKVNNRALFLYSRMEVDFNPEDSLLKIEVVALQDYCDVVRSPLPHSYPTNIKTILTTLNLAKIESVDLNIVGRSDDGTYASFSENFDASSVKSYAPKLKYINSDYGVNDYFPLEDALIQLAVDVADETDCMDVDAWTSERHGTLSITRVKPDIYAVVLKSDQFHVFTEQYQVTDNIALPVLKTDVVVGNRVTYCYVMP